MPQRNQPSESHTTSENTARAFQRGDSEAVQAVRRYVARILAFKRFGVPQRDVEDLVQESMAEIWRSARKSDFDPTAGFWGFVEVVTARRCIDWRRRLRNEVDLEVDVEDPSESPRRRVLLDERVGLVAEALATLGEPCRELLRLRVGEGHSFRELSELLGKREGTLRVQVHRCVRKLESRLRALDPDGRGEGG